MFDLYISEFSKYNNNLEQLQLLFHKVSTYYMQNVSIKNYNLLSDIDDRILELL
tara:strand:- start:554 stop:715 length:162 start_codon:yes stop_codon:yes gene_type:complete